MRVCMCGNDRITEEMFSSLLSLDFQFEFGIHFLHTSTLLNMIKIIFCPLFAGEALVCIRVAWPHVPNRLEHEHLANLEIQISDIRKKIIHIYYYVRFTNSTASPFVLPRDNSLLV